VAEHSDTVRANFEAILDALGRAVLCVDTTTRTAPLGQAKPAGRSV
jgi:hypothetical protein